MPGDKILMSQGVEDVSGVNGVVALGVPSKFYIWFPSVFPLGITGVVAFGFPGIFPLGFLVKSPFELPVKFSFGIIVGPCSL